MKELSLIMFLFGCSYVLVQLINRFKTPGNRQLSFYIPSTANYNILWGFIFYLGYITLKVPSEYKIWLLLIIIFLLGCTLYFRGLHRCLQNASSLFFKKDIIRRLQKQQINDELLNKPYQRKEALRVLGLSGATENDNPRLEQQFALLENFSAKNPAVPYLSVLIKELRRALK